MIFILPFVYSQTNDKLKVFGKHTMAKPKNEKNHNPFTPMIPENLHFPLHIYLSRPECP